MKNPYSSPTLIEIDATDFSDLPVRKISPPSIAKLLTEEEQKNQDLWTQVHRGGAKAILAARTLIAQTRPPVLSNEPPTVPRMAALPVQFVICDDSHVWWLTESGVGRYAADEAMTFDSEMKAEETLASYMKHTDPNGPKLKVRPIYS